MYSYLKLFSILTLIFFALAAAKYPIRKIMPQSRIYTFFFKLHRIFAILAWISITAHGVISLEFGIISITGILLYVAINILIGLGMYKTYINRKLSYKIFKYHKVMAVLTIVLFILHYLQMRWGIL